MKDCRMKKKIARVTLNKLQNKPRQEQTKHYQKQKTLYIEKIEGEQPWNRAMEQNHGKI